MTASLTVVIPTLGRPAELARVLPGLVDQGAEIDSGEAVEIIVVAWADDPRRGAIEGVCADHPGVELLTSAGSGASENRNIGWRAATAPTICFTGDDILPAPGFLAAHIDFHRRRPEAEAGMLGAVRWADELKVTPFMHWLERGIQFDYGSIDGEEAGWGRFYASNASVKRSMLERVDGFDAVRLPFLYEDLDIAWRMSEHGFRLFYEPAAVGGHLHPTDLETYRARIRMTAVAEHAFVDKHPQFEPYFARLFTAAAAGRPARRYASRLAALVPRRTPVIGARIWRDAERYFAQQLAPAFLDAWERSGGEPDQRRSNT